MSNTVEKLIQKIEYYPCGYCTNDLKRIFKDFDTKIVNFYAGVFLLKHREYGYILYDTGYSLDIMKNKLKYFLYRFANPITLNRKDIIDYQLKEKGIETKDIKYIIVSHMHPDHIGGLKLFTEAKFILSKKCYYDYKNKKNSLLIFSEFFPDDFEDRLILVDTYVENEKFPYKKSFDLFSDSSMLLVEVDGHTLGQTCLFVPEYNLFIAADVCWGTQLLDYTFKMKWLPRKIQNNFLDYVVGVEFLEKLIEKNISVVVSHDEREKIIKILENK